MVRKSTFEKNYIEKGILVRPVMDKILPDERIDVQGKANNESLSLQKSIYDGSSIITSLNRGDERYIG